MFGQQQQYMSDMDGFRSSLGTGTSGYDDYINMMKSKKLEAFKFKKGLDIGSAYDEVKKGYENVETAAGLLLGTKELPHALGKISEYAGRGVDWYKGSKDAIQDVKDKMEDVVSKAGSKVKSTLSSVKDGAQDALQDAKGQATQASSQITKSLKSNIDEGAEGDRGEGGEMNEYGLDDPDEDFFKPSVKTSGINDEEAFAKFRSAWQDGITRNAKIARDGGEEMEDFKGTDKGLETKTDEPSSSTMETKGEPDGEDKFDADDPDMKAFDDLLSKKTPISRMGDDPTSEITYDATGHIENFGDEGEEQGKGDEDFDKFMKSGNETPTTKSGDIDFERSNNQINMTREDLESRARETSDMANEDRQNLFKEDDVEPTDIAPPRPLTKAPGPTDYDLQTNTTMKTPSADDDISDLTRTGDTSEAGISSLAEGAGEDLGEEAVTETIGSALDATGVLAPLGFLFNLAGVGMAAYQAGTGISDIIKGGGEEAKAKGEVEQQYKPPPAQNLTGTYVVPVRDSLNAMY